MKKILLILLLLVVVIIAGAITYVKVVLPDVGDAPDLVVHPTPERIARGEYLANHVSVCMDCHSTRDWTKFSGPVAEGTLGKGGEYFGPEMGFPGKFYSKNITPAALDDWTDGELFRTITTGVSKDGSALFPVMPYHAYGKMDQEDIYSIIAYLRAIPAIENEVPESEPAFPMNFIVNTIPQQASPTNRPPETDTLLYGGYLINAAACIDCHTPVDKGTLVMEMAFAGGREFASPGGVLRSSNITPDPETGIGRWTDEAFIGRFKSYRHAAELATVPAGGMNSIMPWNMYAQIDSADLKAMYAYLKTLKPVKNNVTIFEPQP